jgi:hypothetical protein
VVRARVLTNDEDAIGKLEIRQRDRALADADRAAQALAARFVAQVAAIRQVVGAERACEQLVQKRRFVAGAARGVEDGAVGRRKPP